MKTILIQTNKIEIPFNDSEGNTLLTLYFDKSDKNIQRFYDQYEEIQKLSAEMTENNVDEAKDYLKQVFDAILGEGSFDKVYDINPSIIVVAAYLLQIVEGIYQELQSTSGAGQDVLKKYLNE